MSKTVFTKHGRRGRPAGEPSFELSTERQQWRFEWVCASILLAAGVYLSYAYFGQKAVPNSDFTAFVQTGQEILDFRMPASFKRVPVLGILQVAAGKLMFTSPHPILTGGLFLNGILYILSILLFYRICRFFFEKTASFCLGLIGALNPWSLLMVVDPIAETAIVFFVLLTLYLILKRSWWCYLAAMAASMTRYECFMLIGIALLFDLFGRKGKRDKLIAAGLAFAASIPMLLWAVGTKMTATDPSSSYIKHFLGVEHRNGFNLLKMLWQTTFASLLEWPWWVQAMLIERPSNQQTADAIQSHYQVFRTAWSVLTAVFFILGALWVFLKKEWRFLCVLLFWLGYVCIHMTQSVLIDRYTLPVVWLTLLVAAYGLIQTAVWAAARVHKNVLYGAMVFGTIAAVLWAGSLWPAAQQTGRVSAASGSVFYAGLVLVFAALVGKQLIFKGKTAGLDVCLLCVMAVIIVSNQFNLAFRLGSGDLDIEFRKTAEWYLENAEGGKLASTLPGVVNLFLPEGRKNAVHTGGIAGDTLEEFAASCRQSGVKYVAWDSRLGFAVNDEYYKNWGLQKIHALRSGKDVGPFKFIQRIEANPRRYINIFRLESGQ